MDKDTTNIDLVSFLSACIATCKAGNSEGASSEPRKQPCPLRTFPDERKFSNSDADRSVGIDRGHRNSAARGSIRTVVLKLPGGAEHGHGAGGLSYTVCLDSKHLPVAVSMGSGGMVTSYSDWNKPIQIDEPKM